MAVKATFYDVKKREKVEVEVVAKVKYPNGRCALRAKTSDGRNLTKFIKQADYDKAKVPVAK
jgi:hypothetical protein